MTIESDIFIRATRTYCQLSNEHDLDGIASLFAPDISYPPLGEDRSTVMAGQAAFRLKYPKVWWDLLDIRPAEIETDADGAVFYTFDRWWTDSNTGDVCRIHAGQTIQWRLDVAANKPQATKFIYTLPSSEVQVCPSGYPDHARSRSFPWPC
ncbi:MAG: hypothetical protein AAFX93_16565 [Verrucomicrobiota bacterium]